MAFTGSQYKIVRLVLTKNSVHSIHKIRSPAPVARGIEVAQDQGVRLARGDARDLVGDLAGDERQRAPR